MRFLFFISLIAVAGCHPKIYQHPHKTTAAAHLRDTLIYKPAFDKQLYNCSVDGTTPFGKSFHLSGMLFLKKMEDEGIRIVFQNQMGLSFFDFGWDKNDSFQVYNIISQMNKPALIKTLRKDFELLLFKNIGSVIGVYQFHQNEKEDFVKYNLKKGYVYYVIENGTLKRIENANDKRKIVLMECVPPSSLNSLPEHIKIRHLRASFTIILSQIKSLSDNDAPQ